MVGTLHLINGDTYDGVWRNDANIEKGTSEVIAIVQYKYANGDEYKGDWNGDNKEGNGIELDNHRCDAA